MINKFIPLILFLGCCLLCGFPSKGQSYTSSYHANAGNPGSLNQEGVGSLTGWTEILAGGLASNDWSASVALPFPFSFFDVPVTHFKASANGLVTFDTTNPYLPNGPQTLPTDSLPDLSIAVFWESFTGSPPTGTNDEIYVKTFGTAPNRQFWIRWTSFEIGDPAIPFVNMACVLEESSMNIFVVDEYSLTSSSFQSVVGIQKDPTMAVQAGGGFVNLSGNGTAISDNDYYQFTYLPPTDLKISAILAPGYYCSGTDSLIVEVQNTGQDTIDSFTIGYSINGGTALQQAFSGPLFSNGFDTLILGTVSLMPGTIYNIEVFNVSVNGTADSDSLNDTISGSFAPGLSGYYTVNASLPASVSNFQSLAAIANYLTAYGVCGPVTVDVAAGLYSGPVNFGDVAGTSAINAITISGQGAGNTIIQNNTSGTQATVQLKGTDHITFKKLKFKSTHTSNARFGVLLSNGADSVLIDSCATELPVSASADHVGIVASASQTSPSIGGNNANYLTVKNSRFYGGAKGIQLEGTENQWQYSPSNVIENNRFIRNSMYGILADNQNNLRISGNTVDSAYYINLTGIYVSDVNGLVLNGNYVRSTNAGMEIRDINEVTGDSASIANNMVIANNGAGIFLYRIGGIHIYHNSISGLPALRVSLQDSLILKNNILHGNNSNAFESTEGLTSGDVVDYNLYYPTGAGNYSIDGIAYASLGTWKTAEPSYNVHSVEGDPGFISTSDLHVTGFLPNNAGDPAVGVSIDFDGDLRSGQVDIGADEFDPVPLPVDVAVIQLLSPLLPFCPGDTDIYVVIINEGATAIDSLNIHFEVDGQLINDTAINGLNIATGAADSINVGHFLFEPDSVYNFLIYSSSPNGLADNDFSDDTLNLGGIRASLSGSYTIDPALPFSGNNYPSFSSAASALSQFGICGPVDFQVAPGTYNEYITLTPIVGSSQANTIAFEGASASTTILTHNGGTSPATVQMNGADHFTFRNITIANTASSTDAWGVHLRNAANYNTFDSCIIEMPTGTTDDVMGFVASSSLTSEGMPGNNANFLQVSNTIFSGGQSGLHITGDTAGGLGKGNFIEGNTFKNHDLHALTASGQRGLYIGHNIVNNNWSGSGSGIFIEDSDSITIEANYVLSDGDAMQIKNNNAGDSGAVILNNMAISRSGTGMMLESVNSARIYHNSLKGNPGAYIGPGSGLDLRNNMFISEGGHAFEATTTVSVDTIDYNLYHTPYFNPIKVGANTYSSLSAWQAASPQFNQHSVQMEPLFVSDSNLHVLNNAGYDMGVPVGVVLDFDGDTRPGAGSVTVDIGADEMVPFTNDFSLVKILSPLGYICADSSLGIQLVVYNNSSGTLTDIPVVVQVTGSINTTFNDTLYGSFPPFAIDTITFGALNGQSTGLSSVLVLNTNVGDEYPINDSTFASFNIKPLPAGPAVEDTAICIGDTAILFSPFSGQNNWYDANGSFIFTGQTLELPDLQSTETFFVEALDTVSYSLGPVDTSIGVSSNNVTLAAHDLLFRTYQTITIDSIRVFPNQAGNLKLNLRDSVSEAILQTITVPVTPAPGGTMVPVGFEVPPGTYKMDAEGSTTGGFYINNSGANYPYTVPEIASITGNTFSPSYFYYFYDWKISHGLCPSSWEAVTVTVNTAVIELAENVFFCPGDSAILDAGPQYLSYIWNTGDTTASIVVYDTGHYIIDIQDTNLCFAGDTLHVGEYLLPNPDLVPDTGYCSGENFMLQLDPGTGFNTYLWQDGSSAATFTATSSGWYSVTVTDSNCSNTDSMLVTEFPAPSIFLGNDLEYCGNETFMDTLEAVGNFVSYVWQDGSISPQLVVTSEGTYHVTATDPNQCEASDTLKVIALQPPVLEPLLDTVWCAGVPNVFPIQQGPGITTIWYNEAGDTVTQSSDPGWYVRVVIDTNGCFSKDSLKVHECLGITGPVSTGAKVFPNPASTELFIVFQDELSPGTITIRDMKGSILSSFPFYKSSELKVDLGMLPSGTYTVAVTNRQTHFIAPFIVR